MQVGVLADTHFRTLKDGLALLESLLLGPFAGVEIILHAGDLGDTRILDGYLPVPLLGVRGNTDGADARLPERRVVELAGFRIGLIHGWGPMAGLEARVRREFAATALDCLIYGHSHLPACHREGGVLVFNPGSPTDRRSAPCHSAGLLDLGPTLTGRILTLEEPI